MLKQNKVNGLINHLVDQPFSLSESDVCYIPREETYVNLSVLKSSKVEEEFTNSDRETMMKLEHMKLESIPMEDLFKKGDEIVVVRGSGGNGKTTFINMYDLKWAKGELKTDIPIEFVFSFACRELNTVLHGVKSSEDLFEKFYPEIFKLITVADLKEIAGRVMIVVDGVDELQDIFQMEQKSTSEYHHLRLVQELIDPKGVLLPGHKTVICGRPKAAEFVKCSLKKNIIKTVVICGFNPENVAEYIEKFFGENNEKAERVKEEIKNSHNLKVMSSVPVFLWIICHIFSEELITKPLTSNTELYFYSCLVFLRNHSRINNSQLKLDLNSIVNDETILKSLYSLMELSTKTYMENKMVFTENEIKSMPFGLQYQDTGFITKYSGIGVSSEVRFQFSHLVLQEYLCSLYISITTAISPYLSNRELSSCLPTILGIERMRKDKENSLFITFFDNLTRLYTTTTPFIQRASNWFQSFSFQKYMKKTIIPQSMFHRNVLMIDCNQPVCKDFLALLYEAKFDVDIPFQIESCKVINCTRDDDVRNAIFLIKKSKLPITVPEKMMRGKSLSLYNSAECIHFIDIIYESNLTISETPKLMNCVINHTFYDQHMSNRPQKVNYLIKILNIKTLVLPERMTKDYVLTLDGSLECVSTIDVIYEGKLSVINTPKLMNCVIDENFYKDFIIGRSEGVNFLLEKLNVRTITLPKTLILNGKLLSLSDSEECIELINLIQDGRLTLSHTIRTVMLPNNMIQDKEMLVIDDTRECTAVVKFLFLTRKHLDICLEEGQKITTCLINANADCDFEMVDAILQKIGIKTLKLPEYDRSTETLKIHSSIEVREWKLFLTLIQTGRYIFEDHIREVIVYSLKPSEAAGMESLLDCLNIKSIEYLNFNPSEKIDSDMIQLILLGLGNHETVKVSIGFTDISTIIFCNRENHLTLNYANHKDFANLHQVLFDNFIVESIYLLYNNTDILDNQNIEIILDVLKYSINNMVDTHVCTPKDGPAREFLKNQKMHDKENVKLFPR